MSLPPLLFLTVHPRVCGEHLRRESMSMSLFGSSPRLRGTSVASAVVVDHRRFIPASAGNIRSDLLPDMPGAVHPRVCGEHSNKRAFVVLYYGSSPRLRGTLNPKTGQQRYIRFIPASAGNIGKRPRAPFNRPVHPRVCGEHVSARPGTRPDNGSSPRLRGTYGRCLERPLHGRFIPASAGNIKERGYRAHKIPVHPRVCGEHPAPGMPDLPASGSSPRLRGTCKLRVACPLRTRFIPASAGNMVTRATELSVVTVHPRVCGEHSCNMIGIVRKLGSSPRLRGTSQVIVNPVTVSRFIPASAGNISGPFAEFGRIPVHPRVCGEHTSSTSLILFGFK